MQEKAPVITVPLVNEFSQRPHEAHLHMQLGDDGQAPRIWISGVDLGNYESVVGPDRAARHRASFEPQTHQPSVLRRICRRIVG